MERIGERIIQEADEFSDMGAELRDQLEALMDDIAEELEEAQWRWHHVENELARLGRQVRKVRRPARDTAHAVDALADELREGCRKIKRLLR